MRKPKPRGNHKPHSADECGICAKPERERKKKKEVDIVKSTFNDVCEKCGRIYCDHEFKY